MFKETQVNNKKILILTNDPDDLIDRRILLQSRLWIQHGWEVTIVSMAIESKTFHEILPGGEKILRFAFKNLIEVEDDHFKLLISRKKRIRRLLINPNGRIRNFKEIWAGTKTQKDHKPGLYKTLVSILKNKLDDFWFPLPYTATMIEIGITRPSSVVMACDLPALPAATVLAKRWGAKLIYDAHEYYAEQTTLAPEQVESLEYWENYCMHKVDLAYTVSPLIADGLMEKYGLKEKPEVIYNAANFRKEKNLENGGRLRKAIGATSKTKIVLFHGAFGLHRNLENVMSAFARLNQPDTALVYLGYGDLDGYRSLARSLNRDNIFVLDAVPQAELQHWVSDADIGLIPYPAIDTNTRFCLSNKLFDLIEMGIPILANSHLICVSQVVSEYGLGASLPMENEEQIYQALKQVLKEPWNKEEFKKNFKPAQLEFRWNQQAEKLENLLEKKIWGPINRDRRDREPGLTAQGIDCLLINPRQHGDVKYPVISLIYLVAYAREKGLKVDICDAGAELLSDEEVLERISIYNPKVVGFTFMTPQFPYVKSLSDKIMNFDPDIFQIAGGTHVNSVPERSLNELPNLDCLVLDEGEITLVELLKGLKGKNKPDLNEIDGLGFMINGEFHRTRPRPLIQDLDELPMPAWEALPIDQYQVSQPGRRYKYTEGVALTISASRGCPFRCQFCASHAVFPAGNRQRSPKLVADELEYIYKTFNVKHFFFVDEILFLKRSYLTQLCQEIKRRGLPLIWAGNTRADSPALTDEILEIIKDAGCVRVDFGVESGSADILREINKGVSLEQIYSAHRLVQKHGLATTSMMIVGHPSESLKDYHDSIRTVFYLESDYPEFGPATPFPGTELYNIAEKNGWLQSEDWSQYYISNTYRVMRNKYFSHEDINWLTYHSNIFCKIIMELAEKKRYFPEEMGSFWTRLRFIYGVLTAQNSYCPSHDFHISDRARYIKMFLVKDADPDQFEHLLRRCGLQELISMEPIDPQTVPVYVKFGDGIISKDDLNSLYGQLDVVIIAPAYRPNLTKLINGLVTEERVESVKVVTSKAAESETKNALEHLDIHIRVITDKKFRMKALKNDLGTEKSGKSRVFFLLSDPRNKPRTLILSFFLARNVRNAFLVAGESHIIKAGMESLLMYLSGISLFSQLNIKLNRMRQKIRRNKTKDSLIAFWHTFFLTRLSGRLNSFQLAATVPRDVADKLKVDTPDIKVA